MKDYKTICYIQLLAFLETSDKLTHVGGRQLMSTPTNMCGAAIDRRVLFEYFLLSTHFS